MKSNSEYHIYRNKVENNNRILFLTFVCLSFASMINPITILTAKNSVSVESVYTVYLHVVTYFLILAKS